jgi:serine/threonine protein kinase/SAM-dependent methyltransferase
LIPDLSYFIAAGIFDDLYKASSTSDDLDFAYGYGDSNAREDLATVADWYAKDTRVEFLKGVSRAENGRNLYLRKLIRVMNVYAENNSVRAYKVGEDLKKFKRIGEIQVRKDISKEIWPGGNKGALTAIGLKTGGQIIWTELYLPDGTLNLKGIKEFFENFDYDRSPLDFEKERSDAPVMDILKEPVGSFIMALPGKPQKMYPLRGGALTTPATMRAFLKEKFGWAWPARWLFILAFSPSRVEALRKEAAEEFAPRYEFAAAQAALEGLKLDENGKAIEASKSGKYYEFLNAHKPAGMSDAEWKASPRRAMLESGLAAMLEVVNRFKGPTATIAEISIAAAQKMLGQNAAGASELAAKIEKLLISDKVQNLPELLAAGAFGRAAILANIAAHAAWNIMHPNARLTLGLSPDRSKLDPRRFNGYTVVKDIASGETAAIYLARDNKVFVNQVAVKEAHIIGQKDAVLYAKESLERDYEVLSKMRGNKNFPDIGDNKIVEPAEGAPYLVMEYLDGPTLDKWLTTARNTMGRSEYLKQIVSIAEQTAVALEALHKAGTVVCDLSPKNIFIITRNGQPLVKLIDFGASTAIGKPQRDAFTVGTPAYVSVFQKNLAPGNPKFDVYALGMMLMFMVNGNFEFTRSGTVDTNAGYASIRRYIVDLSLADAFCDVIKDALKPPAKLADGSIKDAATLASRFHEIFDLMSPSSETKPASAQAANARALLAAGVDINKTKEGAKRWMNPLFLKSRRLYRSGQVFNDPKGVEYYNNDWRASETLSVKRILEIYFGPDAPKEDSDKARALVEKARKEGKSLKHYLMAKDGPVAAALKKIHLPEDYEDLSGKLFGAIDISKIAFEDVPLWPIDEVTGRVKTELLEWVLKGFPASDKYYAAKKYSISEMRKNGWLPEAAQPVNVNAPAQIDLFMSVGKKSPTVPQPAAEERTAAQKLPTAAAVAVDQNKALGQISSALLKQLDENTDSAKAVQQLNAQLGSKAQEQDLLQQSLQVFRLLSQAKADEQLAKLTGILRIVILERFKKTLASFTGAQIYVMLTNSKDEKQRYFALFWIASNSEIGQPGRGLGAPVRKIYETDTDKSLQDAALECLIALKAFTLADIENGSDDLRRAAIQQAGSDRNKKAVDAIGLVLAYSDVSMPVYQACIDALIAINTDSANKLIIKSRVASYVLGAPSLDKIDWSGMLNGLSGADTEKCRAAFQASHKEAERLFKARKVEQSASRYSELVFLLLSNPVPLLGQTSKIADAMLVEWKQVDMLRSAPGFKAEDAREKAVKDLLAIAKKYGVEPAGAASASDAQELKKLYRRAMFKLHPDVNSGWGKSEEVRKDFVRLAQAADLLEAKPSETLMLPGTFNEYLADHFNRIKKADEPMLTPEQARARYDGIENEDEKAFLRQDAAENSAPKSEWKRLAEIYAEKNAEKREVLIRQFVIDHGMGINEQVVTDGINYILRSMQAAEDALNNAALDKYTPFEIQKGLVMVIAQGLRAAALKKGVSFEVLVFNMLKAVTTYTHHTKHTEGLGLIDAVNIAAHIGWNMTHNEGEWLSIEESPKVDKLASASITSSDFKELLKVKIKSGNEFQDSGYKTFKEMLELHANTNELRYKLLSAFCEFAVETVREYKGLDFPETLIKKLANDKGWMLEFVQFTTSWDINMQAISSWTNRLSPEEHKFVWQLFHKKFPVRSNRGFSDFPPQYRNFINSLISEKKGTCKVLDMGCGDEAEAITELKKLYGAKINASGVDLDMAVSKIGIGTDVSLYESDIRKMPFENDQFDLIYEVGVTGYFKDAADFKDVLCEAMRVLKPDGTFLLTDTSFSKSYIVNVLTEAGFSFDIRGGGPRRGGENFQKGDYDEPFVITKRGIGQLGDGAKLLANKNKPTGGTPNPITPSPIATQVVKLTPSPIATSEKVSISPLMHTESRENLQLLASANLSAIVSDPAKQAVDAAGAPVLAVPRTMYLAAAVVTENVTDSGRAAVYSEYPDLARKTMYFIGEDNDNNDKMRTKTAELSAKSINGVGIAVGDMAEVKRQRMKLAGRLNVGKKGAIVEVYMEINKSTGEGPQKPGVIFYLVSSAEEFQGKKGATTLLAEGSQEFMNSVLNDRVLKNRILKNYAAAGMFGDADARKFVSFVPGAIITDGLTFEAMQETSASKRRGLASVAHIVDPAGRELNWQVKSKADAVVDDVMGKGTEDFLALCGSAVRAKTKENEVKGRDVTISIKWSLITPKNIDEIIKYVKELGAGNVKLTDIPDSIKADDSLLGLFNHAFTERGINILRDVAVKNISDNSQAGWLKPGAFNGLTLDLSEMPNINLLELQAMLKNLRVQHPGALLILKLPKEYPGRQAVADICRESSAKIERVFTVGLSNNERKGDDVDHVKIEVPDDVKQARMMGGKLAGLITDKDLYGSSFEISIEDLSGSKSDAAGNVINFAKCLENMAVLKALISDTPLTLYRLGAQYQDKDLPRDADLKDLIGAALAAQLGGLLVNDNISEYAGKLQKADLDKLFNAVIAKASGKSQPVWFKAVKLAAEGNAAGTDAAKRVDAAAKIVSLIKGTAEQGLISANKDSRDKIGFEDPEQERLFARALLAGAVESRPAVEEEALKATTELPVLLRLMSVLETLDEKEDLMRVMQRFIERFNELNTGAADINTLKAGLRFIYLVKVYSARKDNRDFDIKPILDFAKKMNLGQVAGKFPELSGSIEYFVAMQSLAEMDKSTYGAIAADPSVKPSPAALAAMSSSTNAEDLGIYIEALRQYIGTGGQEDVRAFNTALKRLIDASRGAGPLVKAELARVLDMYADLKTPTVKEKANTIRSASVEALLGAA